MTNKFVIYCAVNFSRPAGTPVSLALVLPDGQWLYAEVLDFDLAECDARALQIYLPLMRRIPGTRFVKAGDLQSLVCEFVKRVERSGEEVEIRYAATSTDTRNLLGGVLPGVASPACIKAVTLNQDRFTELQRHSGGPEKTEGHALIDAIGTALCDIHREIPTGFHEAPIIHLELLLGSKNAMSFRAWARGQEREWEALHKAAA